MECSFDLARVHVRLLCMAKVIADILERNNIPYIISYGTLLGAVRHNGFIPWDDDIDFCLFADSYEQAIQALNKELPNDMFLENENSEPKFFHGWSRIKDLTTKTEKRVSLNSTVYAHQGLDIDLFRITKMKESEELYFRTEEHLKYLERMKRHSIISEDEFKHRYEAVMRKSNDDKRMKNFSTRGGYIFVAPLFYDDRIYEVDMFPLKQYRFEDTYFYGPNNPVPFLKCCYGDYMCFPPVEKRRTHYANVVFLNDR